MKYQNLENARNTVAGGVAKVLKAPANPLLQLQLSEKGLKEYHTGKGCKMSILKSDAWQGAFVDLNFLV